MSLRDTLLRECLRHPRIVAGFWLVIFLGLAAPLVLRLANSEGIIDNSVGIWFLKDDPNLASYEANNDAFGRKDWSLLMLETESVADGAFLRDLAQLTTMLESVPHVRRVLSLTNARGFVNEPGAMVKPVTLFDPASPHASESLKAALGQQPSLERLLLPQGWGTRSVVLIQSDNYLHDLAPYRIQLVDEVHRLTEQMSSVRHHYFAGTTVINAELNRSARLDAIRFYVLVTVMVLLFGWLALRDLGDVAIVVAVLVVAVAGPMGAIALCGIPFNIVTILLPLVLVSLSVCDVIHVINAFHGERTQRSAMEAAHAAVLRLWTPCLWTSIVTVAGILSLAASTVVPIRQMGLFASLGLVLAWLCTMTLVPTLLAVFWKNRVRSQNSSWTPGTYGRRLLPFLAGRWRWLWLSIAVLLMLPAIGIPLLRVDTDYTHFFASKAPVSQAYQQMKEAGMAQSVVEIVVRANTGGALDDVRGRSGLWSLESRVRELPLVRNTLSEANLVAQMDQSLHGTADSARWLSYPDALVHQMREIACKAGLSELDEYSTSDRTRQRILVLTDYMSSHELGSFREAVERIATETLPASASASVLGTTVLWANMDREIETTQIRSILVLVAVFVILLPILFRSIWLGLLGIFINGLPLAMTFGLMGLLGLPLNMATALIGGVSIGSTVDSTLFFINRFQAERASGKSWHEAIQAAVLGVGDGIIMTTAILAGGFLCMTVSSFLPTAHFGIFTCFTILTGAFLDIVINPIVLSLCSPRPPQASVRPQTF